MGLFKRKRKPKSLKKLDNRDKFKPLKALRKTKGKSSISQIKSPYTSKKTVEKKKIRRRTNKVNSLLTPPARRSQPNSNRLRNILSLILVAFSALGLIFFIFFTDFFLIKEFEIFEDNTQITDNLELSNLVGDNLINQNILFYPQEQLSKKIISQNPQYQTVEIEKIYPEKISISIEKYPLEANLTNIITAPEAPPIQKKFILNSQGLIILENQENPELPYIEITTNKAFNLGDAPLTSDQIKYITQTINLFEEKFGIRVISSRFLPTARELHLRTESGFDVWFDINYNNQENSMVPQIEKLRKSLSVLDIYNTPLQYIDLRISGTNAEKVIYKPR